MKREKDSDVDMWLLTVTRGTPGGRRRTRQMRVLALWTVVVFRRFATVLAKAPAAMNIIFLGIPHMWPIRPAHSIWRPPMATLMPPLLEPLCSTRGRGWWCTDQQNGNGRSNQESYPSLNKNHTYRIEWSKKYMLSKLHCQIQLGTSMKKR